MIKIEDISMYNKGDDMEQYLQNLGRVCKKNFDVIRDFSKSPDIVVGNKQTIANNETQTFVFAFIPRKIVLAYSGVATVSGSTESGITTGYVTISVAERENTITVDGAFCSGIAETTSMTVLNGPLVGSIQVFSGETGIWIDWANFSGVLTWNTATKTLTITYTVLNTIVSDNKIGIVATAYI